DGTRALSVEQGVSEFVGVGEPLAALRMAVVHEDNQPYRGVSQEDSGHLLRQAADAGGPDALSGDEVRHVGDGSVAEPEAPTLFFGASFALAGRLARRRWGPKLVGW